MKKEVAIAFFAGVVVTLMIAFLTGSFHQHPVLAQTSSSAGAFVGVTGNYQSQTRDLLYLIDSNTKRLALYGYNNGRLELMAVRNIKYDFQLDEWRPKSQRPSPFDIFKETEGKKKKPK